MNLFGSFVDKDFGQSFQRRADESTYSVRVTRRMAVKNTGRNSQFNCVFVDAVA